MKETPLMRVKAWVHWRKLADGPTLDVDLDSLVQNYELMHECLSMFANFIPRKDSLVIENAVNEAYAIQARECLAQIDKEK